MSSGQSPGKARLAAIQMTSVADVAANLQQARLGIAEAARQGAALAVLPENFACMAADESARVALAEPDGAGPIQDFLAQAARQYGLWIVGGTIPLQSEEPGRPFAACCVWNERGERIGRYDKIHMFDVRVPGSTEAYRESRRTCPGSQVLVLPAPFGQLGVAVCYDLRFPELYRALMRPPCDVISVPAAFTYTTGQAHWELLLRARAVENQCYVVAAAQGGRHENGRRTWGHSLIADPWGQVLALRAEGDGVVVAGFDAAAMADVRARLPALRHRRI